MDIIRRNTDYALRAMANLAGNWGGGPVAVKTIAKAEGISYQLASKLLQRLHKAGFVISTMGPKGGFQLAKEPAKIDLLEVITAIQGPLKLNLCLLSRDACPRRPRCPLTDKLAQLQEHIDGYFGQISLQDMLDAVPDSQ